MTLRMEKLVQELPKNNFNVKKTAIQVGYDEEYANSGIYKQVRKNKAFACLRSEPEKIKGDFNKAKRLALKSGDLANFIRANEALARINAMFTDKQELKAEQTLTMAQKAELVNRIKQYSINPINVSPSNTTT